MRKLKKNTYKNQKPEQNIVSVELVDEMKNSYIDYAMSVITDRALPDVRDGLKPVHRRILYSMYELGMTNDKATRKSARIVGDVLGKFHPHGDTSVYDAMVRMAQDFSMRYPTVSGQGNFGSIDGDGPAAMRYTEAKMSAITQEMLRDINKDAVDFTPNFDETEIEPTVLPATLPHLLVNGTNGIAVGMSTNIPPHNLREVCRGISAYIDNPDITTKGLMQKIKGPDFPTGGTVMGKEGLVSAYETGKGRIKIRAKFEIEETKYGRYRIVATEIPYMENKAKIVENIAGLVKNKKITGISDIRDESDLKNGIRIVIDVRKDANVQIVMNKLYKMTNLETSYSIQMLALVDNVPKTLSLKEIINYYIKHQEEVTLRKTRFNLKKSESRFHILEGCLIALEHIDEVIDIIRRSTNTKSAKDQLIAHFNLTEVQAQAILDMRLAKLTGLEREKIEIERAELIEHIKYLKKIINDRNEVLRIIKEELSRIAKSYGDKRRTQIEKDAFVIEEDELVKKEECAIGMSFYGYINRLSKEEFKKLKSPDKGFVNSARNSDLLKQVITCTTHDDLLFFSNIGKVYRLKVYEIESEKRKKNKTISSYFKLDEKEDIVNCILLPEDHKEKDILLVMATNSGMVKAIDVNEFASVSSRGTLGIKLKSESDRLVSVQKVEKQQSLTLLTKYGYSINITVKSIRRMKRLGAGVRCINLLSGDEVLNAFLVNKTSRIVGISTNGYLFVENTIRVTPVGGKAVKFSGGILKSIEEFVTYLMIEPGSRIALLIDGEEKYQVFTNEMLNKLAIRKRPEQITEKRVQGLLKLN